MLPTREIYWNVAGLSQAAMYLLLALPAFFLAYGVARRLGMWRRARAHGPMGHWGERIRMVLAVALLHRRILRPGNRYAGIMHLFVFWGFVVLFVGTVLVMVQADLVGPYLGVNFLRGTFYVIFKLALNLFGLLFLAGLAMALYRRYVQAPPKFRSSIADDAIVLWTLLALGLTGFLLQALRIAATGDPSAAIEFVSYPIALALAGLGKGALQAIHTAVWWFHMATTMLFLSYVAFSKMFHIFGAPASIFVRSLRAKGELASITNLEEQESFGVSKLADFDWRQLLNADACMRCARCLDYCPTYSSGKPLKPRQLIQEVAAYVGRNGGIFTGLGAVLPVHVGMRGEEWKADGGSSVPGARASGLRGQAGLRGEEESAESDVSEAGVGDARGRDARAPGGDAAAAGGGSGDDRSGSIRALGPEARLIGDVVSEEEIWDCTTCRACMEQCPVMIEHVPMIVEMRRHLVLEQSSFPSELVPVFDSLERRGNPYKMAAGGRADWAKGLDVTEMAGLDDPAGVEVLYWVGCTASYETRNQKVARALVQVFRAAGVSFAILGAEEACCGDPARRSGAEHLYQMLAQQNVEILNGYNPKRIVTACPHCFNTLKNEYPQFGGNYQVVHHSRFIDELIRSGRLTPRAGGAHPRLTYHDPCYLGRYNDVYDEPRRVLERLNGGCAEMPRSRERSFCCGSGGAHAFMDERRGTRISHGRVKEAMATRAEAVVAACPFCVISLADGVRALDAEEQLRVMELSEVVAGALGQADEDTHH